MKIEKSGHVATTGAGEGEQPPLCSLHKRVDENGNLEMQIGGNNCVACSLNERQELLDMLAPLAAPDGSEDSVTVLRRAVEFYKTHVGENRVVVSYPAPATVAEGKPDMQPKCVHCQNAITRHRHSGTWIHAGTGLITCRTLLGSKHDGINHAEPGPSTPTTGAGAREAQNTADYGRVEAAAKAVVDEIWGEAMKLARGFVDANIRNCNDHKGVESLERVYDAKRDTAQQIVNQMKNFNEARWHKPQSVIKILSRHFPPTEATQLAYMHEDELPAHTPKEDYDKWYAQSWLSGGNTGVRVGPQYPFEATQVAVEAAASEIYKSHASQPGDGLSIQRDVTRSIAAIISKHCSADAGEVERPTTPLLRKIFELADLGSAQEFNDAQERLLAIRGLIVGENV